MQKRGLIKRLLQGTWYTCTFPDMTGRSASQCKKQAEPGFLVYMQFLTYVLRVTSALPYSKNKQYGIAQLQSVVIS
jgi:hypothetical protein